MKKIIITLIAATLLTGCATAKIDMRSPERLFRGTPAATGGLVLNQVYSLYSYRIIQRIDERTLMIVDYKSQGHVIFLTLPEGQRFGSHRIPGTRIFCWARYTGPTTYTTRLDQIGYAGTMLAVAFPDPTARDKYQGFNERDKITVVPGYGELIDLFTIETEKRLKREAKAKKKAKS
jgi:hypothetical protein